jgi:hypothetical protein
MVAAVLAALLLPAGAGAQTRTQTWQPGEPVTGQPGGSSGRTSGRTGNQSPFGPQEPPAAPAEPSFPRTTPAIVDMMDRINRFWTEVFTDCGWPAFDPAGTEPISVAAMVADDSTGGHFGLSRRSAFYVASWQPWPVNFLEVILVNDANLYADLPGSIPNLDPGHFAEITLAHEVGHRVQDLRGTMVPSFPPGLATPDTRRREELEADAFAGAYLHWLEANGELPLGMITAGNISRQLKGDDRTGTPRNSLATHGAGHERGAAFMTGVALGLPDDFCATSIALR